MNSTSYRTIAFVFTVLFIVSPVASNMFAEEAVAQPQPSNTIDDSSILPFQPWMVCTSTTQYIGHQMVGQKIPGMIDTPISAQITPIPLIPGVPSPWEAFTDIVNGTVKEFVQGAEDVLKSTIALFVAVPAPGHPFRPETWTPSADENNKDVKKFEDGDGYGKDHDFLKTHRWWNTVWGIYTGLSGLVTIILAVLAVFHHSNQTNVLGNPINHQERAHEAIKVFIMVVFGWILISMYLHGMNILAAGIAPFEPNSFSPSEFINEFMKIGNTGDVTGKTIKGLGVGLLFGALIYAGAASVILISILALLVQWVLIMFAVALFPIAAVVRLSGNQYTQVVSDTVLSLLIGLPMLKLLQVMILRFVFDLPTEGVNLTSAIAVIVMIIGVFIACIYIPIEGTKRLLPDAMIVTGGGGTSGKSKAQAVSSQSTQVKTQIRDGNSSARRSTPNRGSRRRSSSSSSGSSGGSGASTPTTTTSSSSRSSPAGGSANGTATASGSVETSSSGQAGSGSQSGYGGGLQSQGTGGGNTRSGQDNDSEINVTTTVYTQNRAGTSGRSSGGSSGRSYPRHTPQYFLQQMKRTVDKRRRSN